MRIYKEVGEGVTIDEVLIKLPNKWGFKINVNHPYIKDLYIAYKKKVMPPVWWGYAASDQERFQFECIIFNMFRIGGADEERRREYFDKVISGLKKLDYDRLRVNKKADCIIRSKLFTNGYKKMSPNGGTLKGSKQVNSLRV